MKGFSEFLPETSLSRLYMKYKSHDSGTISAFRGEFTKDQNMKRHRELHRLLVAGGYSVTDIDGTYIENFGTPEAKEVKEKSMIVFDYQDKGDLKKVLLKFGEKYDQDSITFSSVKDGNYLLIGTTHREGVEPAYHTEIKLGKPMFGDSGVFHSKVNGRPFVFKEEYEVEDLYSYDDTVSKHHPFISMTPSLNEFTNIMTEEIQ